ncbi:MAG TPA: TonB-dependent receptor, partial [Dinghuibacter sp.]|uniref:SusC/RagA family TonB-linked outer membrane protein n=1 Tax=Dinghuibacter sp. TaxID=2024697 RepID=UPI002BE2BAD6
GYEPQDIKIKGTGDINVVLVQSSVNLEEVVVVGYGSEKKEDLTSAVSTVKSVELNENHASTAVSDMLAGRLPGLYVQRTTGTVGGGSDLKVRGLSTFNNSDPLIVIDGIPDRSLDDLSPTDIDAISVLKDASAIAVYGARAANGVILVTTKRGRAGRPEISFSSTLVDQMPTFMYKKGSSYDYATLQNEAYNNEGSYNPAFGMGFTPDQVALYKSGTDPDHYPNTDWVKELTDGHILQSSYNLSASGGGENVRYFLSAGYVTNGGFVPVEYYKRWNVRSNIDANITKNLKVNLNLGGVFSTTNGEGVYGLDYVIGQALETPPIRVNRFTNGFYAYVPEQRGNAGVQADGQTGFNTTYNNTLNGTLNLQWDIPWIKGLSVVGTGAYDKGYVFGKRFAKPFDQYSIDSSGNFTQVPSYPSAPYLSENFTQNVSLTMEGSLRYANAFGKHHVSALLLYTQTQDNTDLFSAERQNFVSGALPQLDLGDPSQSTNGGNATLSTRQGIVGRATYDYDSRYLLEFSFRDDGSDIFPPGHRFGFFPAVSGGWVISREPFFKNIKNLDFLKLRGSWGELGNDRVAPYQFLTTYSLVGSQYGGGGYTFGGSNPTFYQSLQPGVLANPNFTWERAIMTDIGLEAHYKGDLVTFEADWFHKRTRDILAPPNLQVPSVIGASLPDFNDGIVDNTGFEFTLGHHYHAGKVGYYVEGNMSFNHDKIVYYPESLSTPPWQKITGTSVGGFFNSPYSFYPSGPYLGYKSAGLYQTAQEVAAGPTPLFSTVGPGDIKYVDVDKDGAITANDEVVIGNKFFPGIQYGVRFGANFKGIECNVLLQGSTDVRGINQAAYNNLIPAEAWMQDRWTPEHTNASFPRLWINYQENAQTSTYWVVNTAYMRVKNLEIAYNLPHKLLNRAFKSIRVAVSGNNLITFTKFKWYDPESFNINNSTGDVSNPLMKSLTAGLTVQF